MRSKPPVGVIDPQMQPEFRPRSEHAIGFVGAFRNQVVDKNRGISFGTVEHQRRIVLHSKRCIDPGHDSLARRFFIA